MTSFISYNPATGEPLGVYPIASSAEVNCAVEKAREAAAEWGALDIAARCDKLRLLRERLGADADAMADIVRQEIGKPAQEAYGAETWPAAQAISWLLRHAPRALAPRKAPGGKRARLFAEPYGVIGVIGTWNYPLLLNIAPIAWALMAGNAVVWKPSELATANALALAGHCESVGLPVFTVTGEASTGRALCHAGCDKIAFTGGVRTGRAILTELAANGIPSVMELSGADAMIVCADAPVEMAAQSAVWGRCCNAGQSCVAPQRIFVAREIYERFTQEALRVIQGLRPGVDFSPMRTDALRANVHQIVWDAVPRGARLLNGGHTLDDRPGFYYAPTLLADCGEGMLVMERDFFGPVVAVCPVDGETEAIVRANNCEMGLGASVWTRSPARARQIAGKLRAGLVVINDVLRDAAEPALPFGGMRASGFGKQHGLAGLDEFVHWKVIAPHPLAPRPHLFPYRPAGVSVLKQVIALETARNAGEKLRAIPGLLRGVRQWLSEGAPKEAVAQPAREDEAK